MPLNSDDIDAITAQADALSIAFRAMLAVLPAKQADEVRQEISKRTDDYLKYLTSASGIDTYVSSLSAHVTLLQQHGPERGFPLP